MLACAVWMFRLLAEGALPVLSREVERSLEGARPAMKRLYHKLDKEEERRWSRKCCGGGVNRN